MNYLNQLTEQLSDGVYVIKVPLPGNPLKNINSYVIKGKERNLIVDTAFNMPECLMAFELGLTVLGVDMRNTDIFLTHLHSDHTGLAASIASPESRVFISREDRVRLENFMEKEYWEQVYDVYKSYGFSEKELEEISVSNPASIYMPKIKIKYCDVENGHIIDLGGRKLTCISTPGHTPGHMCLYDEANGILFCGDLMLFDITPNITSWSNFDNPLAQYLNSLNKIKDLDIKTVYVAHREYTGDHMQRIDQLLSHHDIRLNEAYNYIKSSGCATPYDTAAHMTWSIKAKDWADFPVTQKWFAVGEANAHIEYLINEGKLKSDFRDGKFFFKPVSG